MNKTKISLTVVSLVMIGIIGLLAFCGITNGASAFCDGVMGFLAVGLMSLLCVRAFRWSKKRFESGGDLKFSVSLDFDGHKLLEELTSWKKLIPILLGKPCQILISMMIIVKAVNSAMKNVDSFFFGFVLLPFMFGTLMMVVVTIRVWCIPAAEQPTGSV